jgi:hypothetical protein
MKLLKREKIPVKELQQEETNSHAYFRFLTKVQGIYGQEENTASKESSIFIFCLHVGLKT